MPSQRVRVLTHTTPLNHCYVVYSPELCVYHDLHPRAEKEKPGRRRKGDCFEPICPPVGGSFARSAHRLRARAVLEGNVALLGYWFFFSALAAAPGSKQNKTVWSGLYSGDAREMSWHEWMIRWCESLEKCKESATVRSRSIKEYAKVADTEYKRS